MPPCECGKDCDCGQARKHLFEYIDAEMPPEILTQIKQHIAECPECGYEEQLARHYKEVMHRCCSQCEPAPEALKMRIVQQMRVWESQRGLTVTSITETRIS